MEDPSLRRHVASLCGPGAALEPKWPRTKKLKEFNERPASEKAHCLVSDAVAVVNAAVGVYVALFKKKKKVGAQRGSVLILTCAWVAI